MQAGLNPPSPPGATQARRVAWGAKTEFRAPSCITSMLPVISTTRPGTSDMQDEERSPPVRLLYADELGQLKGD